MAWGEEGVVGKGHMTYQPISILLKEKDNN